MKLYHLINQLSLITIMIEITKDDNTLYWVCQNWDMDSDSSCFT